MKIKRIRTQISRIVLLVISTVLITACSTFSTPAKNPNLITADTERASSESGQQAAITELYSRVTIQSAILKKPMAMNVYLPNGYDPQQKYPVLYALHGTGSDEGSSWLPGRRADSLAAELLASGKIHPYIIVTPMLDNSWVMNTSLNAHSIEVESNSGRKYRADVGMYEDYFIKEVIPYVETHYSTITTRDGRYIGGISMGGFAAARLAIKYPQLFGKVGLHSPALALPDWSPSAMAAYYPKENPISDNHPMLLIDHAKIDPSVQFYIDCGEQDNLYAAAKQYFEKLKAKGLNAQFHSAPGKHDNKYMTPRIKDYLMFYGTK